MINKQTHFYIIPLILITLLFSFFSSGCGGDCDDSRLGLSAAACAPPIYPENDPYKKENKSIQSDSSVTPQDLRTSTDAESDKN